MCRSRTAGSGVLGYALIWKIDLLLAPFGKLTGGSGPLVATGGRTVIVEVADPAGVIADTAGEK